MKRTDKKKKLTEFTNAAGAGGGGHLGTPKTQTCAPFFWLTCGLMTPVMTSRIHNRTRGDALFCSLNFERFDEIMKCQYNKLKSNNANKCHTIQN